MAEWQEPKTDWQGYHTDTQEYDPTSDNVGANDFNRIEENTQYLKETVLLNKKIVEISGTKTIASGQTDSINLGRANGDYISYMVTAPGITVSLGEQVPGLFVYVNAWLQISSVNDSLWIKNSTGSERTFTYRVLVLEND